MRCPRCGSDMDPAVTNFADVCEPCARELHSLTHESEPDSSYPALLLSSDSTGVVAG